MLCKICGKEMVHSYEIKYILPEIFRKLGGVRAGASTV